jgi:hypothetical protein
VPETIVAESMVARLVSASGENLWAWDDTKACLGSKANALSTIWCSPAPATSGWQPVKANGPHPSEDD